MNEKLLATARFYFAQSVFMENIHYKAYGRLQKKQERNKTIVIIIAALTFITIILQIFGLDFRSQSILTMVSYLGLILTGASLIYEIANKDDISEIKCSHKSSAEEYKSVRDRYMCLIEEIMNDRGTYESLSFRRNSLQEEYSRIGKYAPCTTYDDYTNAQKSLGVNGSNSEEFTWSNEEINRFLPTELRIK